MTAIFIVCLPGGHIGVCAITFGQKRDNARAFFAIAHMGKTIVAARSKPARPAFDIKRQHVRMFVDHPPWRCCGRGAQKNPEAHTPQDVDGLVQPFKLKRAGRRLQTRPGKFANPDPSQPRLNHTRGVTFPDLWVPMFWIVAST